MFGYIEIKNKDGKGGYIFPPNMPLTPEAIALIRKQAIDAALKKVKERAKKV